MAAKILNMEGQEIKSEEDRLREQEFFKDMISYEVADLVVECGKCGKVSILKDKWEGGGIQFNPLPSTNKHQHRLDCPECNNFMSMYFIGYAGEKSEIVRKGREKIQEQLEKNGNEAKEDSVEAEFVEELHQDS